LALEALLYRLTVNAEQISTAGEKELLSKLVSLGRGLWIMLGYNTQDARRPVTCWTISFCFDKQERFPI
jgi:hypothetical protein